MILHTLQNRLPRPRMATSRRVLNWLSLRGCDLPARHRDVRHFRPTPLRAACGPASTIRRLCRPLRSRMRLQRPQPWHLAASGAGAPDACHPISPTALGTSAYSESPRRSPLQGAVPGSRTPHQRPSWAPPAPGALPLPRPIPPWPPSVPPSGRFTRPRTSRPASNCRLPPLRPCQPGPPLRRRHACPLRPPPWAGPSLRRP